MIVKIVPQHTLLHDHTVPSINYLGHPHIWKAIMGHLWENPQRNTFVTMRQVSSELQVLAEQRLYEHVAVTFVPIKHTHPVSSPSGSPPSTSRQRRAELRAAKHDAARPTAHIEIRHPDGGRRIPGLRWGRESQDDHELCLSRLQEHVRVGIDVVTAGFDGPIVLSKEDEADLMYVFAHRFDRSVETPPFMRVHGTGAPECLTKLHARKFVQFIEPRGDGSPHEVLPHLYRGRMRYQADRVLPPVTFYLTPDTVETLVVVWRGRTDSDPLQDPVSLPGQGELCGLREIVISVQRTTGGRGASRTIRGVNSSTLLLDLDQHLSRHMGNVPHTVLGLEHIAEQWVGLNPRDSRTGPDARLERVRSKIRTQCATQSSFSSPLFDSRTSWPSYAEYHAQLGPHRFAQLLALPGEQYPRACERLLNPTEILFEPPVQRWQALPSVRDEKHPEPRLRKRGQTVGRC